MMNTLTGLITLLVAISMAVERVIEILKGFIPPLAKERQGAVESVRRAFLQVLAAIVGAAVAYGAQSEIGSTVPALSAERIGWLSYPMVGLLASGGSGLWNHTLDIVRAMKVRQEETRPKLASSQPPA